MRKKEVVVSVIIPVWNGMATIAEAIESVLKQRAPFNVEILVVDDGSDDGTAEVISEPRWPDQVKVLRFDSNRGKGAAVSAALKVAKGRYFQVLDADDYLVDTNKLNRQVQFLESHFAYFGVGSNVLIRYSNGTYGFGNYSATDRDFDHLEFLEAGYAHSSSTLYRMLQETLPREFETVKEFRGDTALGMYLALTTKGKFLRTTDLASVYRVTGHGLWTSLSQQDRARFNSALLNRFAGVFASSCDELEASAINRRIDRVAQATGIVSNDTSFSIGHILWHCRKLSNRVLETNTRAWAFQGTHSLKLVDQMLESIGREVIRPMLESAPSEITANLDVVLVSGLRPKGGGVAGEVKALLSQLRELGRSILVVSTQSIDTSAKVFSDYLGVSESETYLLAPEQAPEMRLESFFSKIIPLAPARIIAFVTHNDVVGAAALQADLTADVLLNFVYDHGSTLGLLNSGVDAVIVKSVEQAEMILAKYPFLTCRVIPPIVERRADQNRTPPTDDMKVTTASASVRSYKVENDHTPSFEQVIASVLEASGGTHIHFGPLSDKIKRNIKRQLGRRGLDKSLFVHKDFTPEFQEALFVNGVNLFLDTFPIPGIRTSLEARACGIPVMTYGGPVARSLLNSKSSAQLGITWETEDDLRAIIGRYKSEERALWHRTVELDFAESVARSVDGWDTPFVSLGDVVSPRKDFRSHLSDMSEEPNFGTGWFPTKSVSITEKVPRRILVVRLIWFVKKSIRWIRKR